MSAVQPFQAWFFFAADDTDEVDRIYAQFGIDEDGWQRWPVPDDLVDTVLVIAVEPPDSVWFLRNGQVEYRPSWMIRDANMGKLAEVQA